MKFRIIPIPIEIADEARSSGLAPHFGHPTHVHVTSEHGYGPCRLCLRRTIWGEKRVLFNYNPTRGLPGIPFGGPIVIHLEPCEPYVGEGVPKEWEGLPLALSGHLKGGTGTLCRVDLTNSLECEIQALLNNPEVDYITIRNTDPDSACYIARVERI